MIREAIYVHKVVIVKGQRNLLPIKQFELVHRLDPDAEAVHGFATKDVTDETTGVLGVRPFPSHLESIIAEVLSLRFRRDSTQSPIPKVLQWWVKVIKEMTTTD